MPRDIMFLPYLSANLARGLAAGKSKRNGVSHEISKARPASHGSNGKGTASQGKVMAPLGGCPQNRSKSSSAKSTAQNSAVRIIDLPKITDQRGNLTFIEGDRHVPFPIRRVYYLYDVPAGAMRGGHAHKKLQQFVIAASGSFTVVIDDGRKRKRYFLNRPHYGLYIPRMVWRELENFSSGSICVVLASEEYEESDYYRDYDEFRTALRKEEASSVSRSARRISGTQKADRRSHRSRSR